MRKALSHVVSTGTWLPSSTDIANARADSSSDSTLESSASVSLSTTTGDHGPRASPHSVARRLAHALAFTTSGQSRSAAADLDIDPPLTASRAINRCARAGRFSDPPSRTTSRFGSTRISATARAGPLPSRFLSQMHSSTLGPWAGPSHE